MKVMREYMPIDRQTELPPAGQGRPKYPFMKLEPVKGNPPRGDSFLVPCTIMEMKKTMNSLTHSANYFAYRSGRKFALRRMPDGVRVWRIA